jgi:uncharacterized protein (DUF302 family)
MNGDMSSNGPTKNGGVDLPLKPLVWEAADGNVWLSYNNPEFLRQRHRLDSAPLAAIENLLRAVTNEK